MQDFKEIFNAYGADYESTMERFMRNEGMYLRFLDMLFQDGNLQKLGNALQSGSMTEAFEAAHTLKGVTGNMGLTPLYAAVCRIVEPLRRGEEGEDYAALYQTVLEEFARAEELRSSLKWAI
jgi:HPt (histidine-containing phosphotransfer) domain-containing protein